MSDKRNKPYIQISPDFVRDHSIRVPCSLVVVGALRRLDAAARRPLPYVITISGTGFFNVPSLRGKLADSVVRAPRRSSRCLPTRRALATMVRVGFTAPLETKKLPST